MSLEFGTDGVRGVANKELTPEFVVALGRVAGGVLGNTSEISAGPSCILGRDTRASGPMLSGALAAGLAGAGVDVVDVGVIPTAAIALLARDAGAAMGAVISASHNPAPDNGIKFFGPSGAKLADAKEREIEQILQRGGSDRFAIPDGLDAPTGGQIGRVDTDPQRVDEYARILLETVTAPLDGLRIVVDAANGSAARVGPEVLERAGARVDVTNASPDGSNINAGCGAMAPEGLAAAVRDSDADIGIAFDGDADRLIPVDERGSILDGDHILAMCAVDMYERGLLSGKRIVATVMSNVGLRLYLDEHGIGVVECAVGDRNVLNTIDDNDLALGGEQSGHVIFRDLAPTGCGILTALQVCQVVARSGLPVSELANRVPHLPQKLVNMVFEDKSRLDHAPEFWRSVADVESELGNRGRVVVRPSGTEPKLRIMVQAETEDAVTKYVAELVEAAERIG